MDEKQLLEIAKINLEDWILTPVVALVSVMSGVYRHSHRMIESAMSDFFGVKMSLGTINRMRKEASTALSSVVDEAKSYIQSAQSVCADS
jgi:transposase